MIKSIIMKEWLKLRIFLVLSLLCSFAIIVFLMLDIRKTLYTENAINTINLMLGKDIIFVNLLQYFPLLVGIVLGVCQWLPEMIQKRLKLTLHLPIPYFQSVGAMGFFGVMYMLILALTNLFIIYTVESIWFPYELVRHTIMTLLTWYLAGMVGYILCSWVIIEPTWKVRIGFFLISFATIALFYLSDQPEVYNHFLPLLCVLTAVCLLFPFYSVYRFKIGKGL